MISEWYLADSIGLSCYDIRCKWNFATEPPSGLDTQFSVQLGGTAALGILGLGGSIGAGINVPTNPLNLGGYQIFGNIPGNGMLGLGAFIGGGATGSMTTSDGPLSAGLSGSGGWYAEGDIGADDAVSASIQGNTSGVNGMGHSVLPSVGAGLGGWVGAGGNGNGAFASPTTGQMWNSITSFFGLSPTGSGLAGPANAPTGPGK
jgi:hypothetical protein